MGSSHSLVTTLNLDLTKTFFFAPLASRALMGVFVSLVLTRVGVSEEIVQPSDSPEFYFGVGAVQSPQVGLVLEHFQSEFWRAKGHPHLRTLGFYPLFFGLSAKVPSFPYYAALSGSRRIRFRNFGSNGFFLGQAQESSVSVGTSERSQFEPLEWGAYFLTAKAIRSHRFQRYEVFLKSSMGEITRLLKTPELASLDESSVRQSFVLLWAGGLECLSEMSSTTKDMVTWKACDHSISKKLSQIDSLEDKQQLQFVLTPSLEEGKAICFAGGHSQPPQSLPNPALFGFASNSQGKARCLTSVSEQNDSLGLVKSSQVHCMKSNPPEHFWEHRDRVDLVLPTRDSQTFVLLETSFQPAKETWIDLSAGEFWQENSVSGFVKRQNQKRVLTPKLPKRWGRYHCVEKQHGVHRHTLFTVPEEIYRGTDVVQVKADEVIAHEEQTAKTSGQDRVVSAKLTWLEASKIYPELDSIPQLGCALLPDVDAKCGLRVVQTAIQLLSELDSPPYTEAIKPSVQQSSLVLMGSLLRRVSDRLGAWMLSKRVKLLQTALEQKLNASQDSRVVSENQSDQRVLDERRFEPVALDNNLSVPDGFWNRLRNQVKSDVSKKREK